MWECGLKLCVTDVSDNACTVTPYVGVWIETFWNTIASLPGKCHSLCGSVDWNLPARASDSAWDLVTPYVGVWIETEGLDGLDALIASLLMWECGLKRLLLSHRLFRTLVTPYVGVWIETTRYLSHPSGRNGHSLCGSVDWNLTCKGFGQCVRRHSLCGSVDWNSFSSPVQTRQQWSLLMWECGLKPSYA